MKQTSRFTKFKNYNVILSNNLNLIHISLTMAYAVSNHHQHRPKLLMTTSHQNQNLNFQQLELGYNESGQPRGRVSRQYHKDRALGNSLTGIIEPILHTQRNLKPEAMTRRQNGAGTTATSMVSNMQVVPPPSHRQTIQIDADDIECHRDLAKHLSKESSRQEHQSLTQKRHQDGSRNHRAKSGNLPTTNKGPQADITQYRIKSKTSRGKQGGQNEPHRGHNKIGSGVQGQLLNSKNHRRVNSQLHKQKIANCLLMHEQKYNSHMFNDVGGTQEEQASGAALDSFRNNVKLQCVELTASTQQLGYTRNTSSLLQTSSNQPTDQSRIPQKACDNRMEKVTATRDQSRGSSNTSGHRKSSLTSANKTLLHPTPSQQLNQKNKLIERSRANCIKNLQRLIEQRSLVVEPKNMPHGKRALNRTTEFKNDNIVQQPNKDLKPFMVKPKSAYNGGATVEDLQKTIQKSTISGSLKTPNQAASASTCGRTNSGKIIASLNSTGPQQQKQQASTTQRAADVRDRKTSSMAADVSAQVLRSLNFDSRQNQAKNAPPPQSKNQVLQPIILSTRSNAQSSCNKVGNFGSTLTARDFNSSKQLAPCHQDAEPGFSGRNYSPRSSTPVTQGFTSTQNSNELSANSENCQDNQNINQLNLGLKQAQVPHQPQRQRFIQPLRTMKTKKSKMIDLNKNYNQVKSHAQLKNLTGIQQVNHTYGRQGYKENVAVSNKVTVATKCIEKTKAAAQTVRLDFPNSCMQKTNKQSTGGLSNRPRLETSRPPAKYQVNSLKNQILSNNFKKKKNQNVKVDQILQNVMTVQRAGSDDGKIPFPGSGSIHSGSISVNQQKTAKMTQGSITSDCIMHDISRGSQPLQLCDSHIPNMAAHGDLDHSPQQLTGFSNSNHKHHQQSTEENREGVMQTSQSWSQMQSVSSDSHNKVNKHIRSINGQNFLPEYNNFCYRSLLEPRIIPPSGNPSQYISDASRDGSKESESVPLRALLSRNKYNLNLVSLQGSLTDIQAAPSIMEVDVTVASQARMHAAQKTSFRSSVANGTAHVNQAVGTPTVSYGLGVANAPTTEKTTGHKEPLYRGSNRSNDDLASSQALRQGSQHSKQAIPEDFVLSEQQRSPGFAKANIKEREPSIELVDRVSEMKHGTDEEDLCQIDKITTERSQPSSRQQHQLIKPEVEVEERPLTRGEVACPDEADSKDQQPNIQGTDERLLNINKAFMSEQVNTIGTDTSMIKEEMMDQVAELMSAAPQYPPPPNGTHENSCNQNDNDVTVNEQDQQCQDNLVTAEYIEQSSQIYNQHFQQTLNIMRNLELLEPYSNYYLSLERVLLPEPTEEQKSYWPEGRVKVIFFDIDETMIHCIDDRDSPDMKGEVTLHVKLEEQTDDGPEDAQSIQIQINLRPGLRECLLDLSKSFQLISFTASDQSYADTILDHIDPNRELFMARLYRQHCVETQYGLIKDLRLIGNSDLRDMILIDNSALSFAFNVNNGIPILPFFDDVQDEELKHLNYYLNCLRDSKVDDVRLHNDEAFGLLRLQQPGGEGGQTAVAREEEGALNGIAQGDEEVEGQARLTGGGERAEFSGEYVIRDDEISTHHAMSKDYLQCDPIEMTEDRMNKQSSQIEVVQSTAHEYGLHYVDQPISLLNLMNPNQVIEERSNEDEGQTSSPHSPSLMASSKSKEQTKQDLSIGLQQLSQLQRASHSQSIKDQSLAGNRPGSQIHTPVDPTECLPYIDQSQIFDQLTRNDLSRGSSSARGASADGKSAS